MVHGHDPGFASAFLRSQTQASFNLQRKAAWNAIFNVSTYSAEWIAGNIYHSCPCQVCEESITRHA